MSTDKASSNARSKSFKDKKTSLEITHVKSLRLMALAILAVFGLNALVGLFSVPAVMAGRDGDESKKSSSAITPQFVSQNAALFNAGQFSSALNVAASGDALFPEVRIGSEDLQPPRWSGDWAGFGMFSSEPIRLQEPFNQLKANWQAVVPEGTQLEMDLRASPDGQNWTLWEVLDQNNQTAMFDPGRAYLYTQYRVRLFTATDGVSPAFKGVQIEANRRSLNNLMRPNALNIMANADNSPPTYKVYATREGLVGYTTANGHKIEPNDHFVSLPSWTALNDKGKSDYRVRIVAPNGRSAIAPVWDTGPWNFKDNYWHNPRYEFKDLPVGVPQAEKAVFEKHNGGKNESGVPIYNPSGIDIGDGTYWDDLGLQGASGGKLEVTFLWEGSVPGPAAISGASATNIGSGTANIVWTTGQPTNAWVEYGFDTNYGFNTPVDNNMDTNHNVFIGDLVPNKTYHVRVHGKDIYGTETVSNDFTFTTYGGVVTALTAWQNDQGIGVHISPKFDAVTVAGGRANQNFWGENAKPDTNAGASTIPGNVGAGGAIDLDITPTCDDKGQNCTLGFGSGYKAYVQFTNSAGDMVQIGMIHDVAVSPSSATLMIEGKVGGNSINRYSPPDSLDPTRSHHLHAVWVGGQLYLIFDFNARFQYTFNAEGMQIAFAGAGRAKDDVIAVNFHNINFSFGSVITP